jgi:hypothetical protein
MTKRRASLSDWFIRITNPRLYAAMEIARAITSDPETMEKMSRRAVSEPVEWSVPRQSWGVHTYGLTVGQFVYIKEGRGGVILEPARVTDDLGSGYYLLAFDIPEESLDMTEVNL